MQVKVEKIIYPGKSLSRQEGKVIFSDEGLPGETINVEVVKDKKNFIEAVTTDVLTRSAHRVEPKCVHYRICSPYQYIDYRTQLDIKRSQVEEMFSHAFPAGYPPISVSASPEIWGYRNKIQINVVRKNARYCFAYHVPRSHEDLFEIDECHLAGKKMNDLMKNLLKTMNGEADIFSFVREVTIKENSAKDQMMLVLSGNNPSDLEKAAEILSGLKKHFPLRGIIFVNTDTQRHFILSGEDMIEENVNGKLFLISSRSFFQVNVPALKELLKDLEKEIGHGGILVDLFCGGGAIGVALSDKFEKVIGVESSKENLYLLKKVLKRNNIPNYKIYEGECAEHIEKILSREINTLIIDPPRKGLDGFTRDKICAGAVPCIAYISCDPATMARDLKIFSEHYDLRSICLYDFFPQTPHIELMVVLRKKA